MTITISGSVLNVYAYIHINFQFVSHQPGLVQQYNKPVAKYLILVTTHVGSFAVVEIHDPAGH